MLFLALLAHAEFVDLHIHLAAHLAVPVYGRGPEEEPPAHPSNLHGLKPQIFLSQLEMPGPSILVSLAYANPFLTVFESRRSMKARIERQLRYVEEFCQRHPEHFELARSPEEARNILASGRTVVVHGIEGGTKILENAGDARYWAERGVAVMTPIHLADNAVGGAWCQEGSLSLLNLPGCRRERRDPEGHGLREPERIRELLDAGIILDLAHMSHASFAESIAILREKGRPPVYSHVTAEAVREDSVALRDDELRAIKELHGLVGVTANLSHLAPRPEPATRGCPGSLDDFRLQWDHIVKVFEGEPVGWGSDFQGGVDHPRPRYGPRGCGSSPDRPLESLDWEGLAHPGQVEPMFAQMAREGSDRGPLDASAQRFLEVWESNR